jgi:Cu-processing system ATP-binding protein
MIKIQGLRKRYGSLEVLRGLDLEIERGKVTAILGPNGAGKTTLIKCMLGLVRPEAGEIAIAGETINGDAGYRARLGYMPQIPRFPENLTVREILHMVKDLRGRFHDLDEEAIDMFELGTQNDKQFKALSGGNRQRVSAAIAFLFRPDVLILDEPTAGLDPLASSSLKDKVLRERENGRTVILTSHVMSEVEDLADRVIYIVDGAVNFDSSVADLLASTAEGTLERAIARMMIRVAA